MGQIKVLDQNTINMIAAGEVIERPASAVKELVENSIDAGATEIAIYVEDGGKALIRVIDNGCGMDAQDLSVAFEAHATSKLKSSVDLLNISTLRSPKLLLPAERRSLSREIKSKSIAAQKGRFSRAAQMSVQRLKYAIYSTSCRREENSSKPLILKLRTSSSNS
jgi:DNA mismatch repair protein MutL